MLRLWRHYSWMLCRLLSCAKTGRFLFAANIRVFASKMSILHSHLRGRFFCVCLLIPYPLLVSSAAWRSLSGNEVQLCFLAALLPCAFPLTFLVSVLLSWWFCTPGMCSLLIIAILSSFILYEVPLMFSLLLSRTYFLSTFDILEIPILGEESTKTWPVCPCLLNRLVLVFLVFNIFALIHKIQALAVLNSYSVRHIVCFLWLLFFKESSSWLVFDTFHQLSQEDFQSSGKSLIS